MTPSFLIHTFYRDCQPPMPDKFGIQSPPITTNITKHISNLTSQSLEDWNLPKSITDTFIDIFDYLAENHKKIEKSINLSRAQLVPIEGRRLAQPSRVYFRIHDNLTPFLFQVPSIFLKYEKLLKVMDPRNTLVNLAFIGNWSKRFTYKF